MRLLVISRQGLPDRLADPVAQELPLPQPAGLPPLLGRLDVGDPTPPVQVGRPPAPTGQQEDRRPAVPVEEGRFVDGAQLLAAPGHLEERRRREDGEQVHEVLPPVLRLPLGGEGQDAPVAPEDLGGDHGLHERRDDGPVHLREGGDRPEPPQPLGPADPPLLEAEGHQLLGQDVVRLGRGLHGLHVALPPEPHEGGGPEQGLVARRQEEAVRGVPRPPPRPAHPLMALGLQERGIGRSEWLDWVRDRARLPRMDRAVSRRSSTA